MVRLSTALTAAGLSGLVLLAPVAPALAAAPASGTAGTGTTGTSSGHDIPAHTSRAHVGGPAVRVSPSTKSPELHKAKSHNVTPKSKHHHAAPAKKAVKRRSGSSTAPTPPPTTPTTAPQPVVKTGITPSIQKPGSKVITPKAVKKPPKTKRRTITSHYRHVVIPRTTFHASPPPVTKPTPTKPSTHPKPVTTPVGTTKATAVASVDSTTSAVVLAGAPVAASRPAVTAPDNVVTHLGTVALPAPQVGVASIALPAPVRTIEHSAGKVAFYVENASLVGIPDGLWLVSIGGLLAFIMIGAGTVMGRRVPSAAEITAA